MLEEALLAFAQTFGLQVTRLQDGHSEVESKQERPVMHLVGGGVLAVALTAAVLRCAGIGSAAARE